MIWLYFLCIFFFVLKWNKSLNLSYFSNFQNFLILVFSFEILSNYFENCFYFFFFFLNDSTFASRWPAVSLSAIILDYFMYSSINLPVTHHSWKLPDQWPRSSIMVQLHSVKPYKTKNKPDARPKSNWNNVFSAVNSFSELNMIWLKTGEQLQASIMLFVSLALGL